MQRATEQELPVQRHGTQHADHKENNINVMVLKEVATVMACKQGNDDNNYRIKEACMHNEKDTI